MDQKAERARSEGRTELLSSHEVEELELARERASTTAGVGAPPILAQFHKWMAAQFLYERAMKVPAEDAHTRVCEQWEVTRTTVIEALKDHEQGALELFAIAREFAVSESTAMNDIWGNIAVVSKCFRDLSKPK
jgi:hypothetical protein